MLIGSLCFGLSACSLAVDEGDRTTDTTNTANTELDNSEKEEKTEETNIESSEIIAFDKVKEACEISYSFDTVFESYNYQMKISKVSFIGYEGDSKVEMMFDITLVNSSSNEMKFILPARLEKGQINGKDIIEEVTSRSKKSDDGEVAVLVDGNAEKQITHTISCDLINGAKVSDFTESDTVDFEFRYAADYSDYQPTYIAEHIKNTTDAPVEEPVTFITKSNPVFFENFDGIDCDGIMMTIDKLKVCSDLESYRSAYNFYYIVLEYTVENTTSTDAHWNIQKANSNIYGDFVFDKYERYLGGNTFIKDEDITSKWISGGSLKPGEKKTYSMTLIVDKEMDDPEGGLQLMTDSKMKVILPFHTDSKDYTLTYELN